MSGIQVSAHERTKSYGTKLTTTDATAVYTAGTTVSLAKGIALNLCNVDGSAAVNVTVEWYDASANVSYSILSTKSIAADDHYPLDLMGLALEKSDEVRVTASAADDVHCVITVTETFGRLAS